MNPRMVLYLKFGCSAHVHMRTCTVYKCLDTLSIVHINPSKQTAGNQNTSKSPYASRQNAKLVGVAEFTTQKQRWLRNR